MGGPSRRHADDEGASLLSPPSATPPNGADKAGTRSDQLSQRLEDMIVAGALRPGARLDESTLAARFGVSRTPVREAIQRLTAMGLVELQARKGPVVAVLPVSKLVGMFEVMAEFDVLAARLAARRATQEDRSDLSDLVERSRSAVDEPAAYTVLNRDFHWRIYAASQNDYLKEVAIRTWKQLQPYRNFRLEQPDRLRESLAQHEGVLEAIQAFDADLAATRMSHHVRLGGIIAEAILTMPPDAFRPR